MVAEEIEGLKLQNKSRMRDHKNMDGFFPTDTACCIYGLLLTVEVPELHRHYSVRNTVSGVSKPQRHLPVRVSLRLCPVSLCASSQYFAPERLELDWDFWILLD